MIIIAGTISFDPAKAADLEAGFDTMQAATLQEAGCVSYDLYFDRKTPGKVLVFERWADDEALAAHMASPHMAAFGAVMGAVGITGVDMKKYTGATEGPLF